MGPLGIPTPNNKAEMGDSVLNAFFVETFAIMLIHIVRISLLIDRRGHKDSNGIAIGAAYTGLVAALAPISGGCFNPARSIGPIFFLNRIASNSQLIMAGAPFLGTTIGMWIYKRYLISDELEDELDEL